VRIDTVTAVHPGPPFARVELASGKALEADAVVLAMGPWTDQIGGGLVLPRMLGQKYHSLSMQIGRVLDQAIFFQGRGEWRHRNLPAP
jgi:glycine/D-amino acid oxidase-like deaminating enzyme